MSDQGWQYCIGKPFSSHVFFHDPSIDKNLMKWLDLILLSMTPILVPAFHPSIDTKSYWILGPISSELYQLYQRLMWRTRGFRRVWPQNCVRHVSINGVSPRLSIVLTFILTIGRKPTGHPKFWMAKEPVSYYVFICIYHNVGNSQCHVHHPPVITTYIYIRGMVPIPGNEWFLALLPYLTLPIFHIFHIFHIFQCFNNIYQHLWHFTTPSHGWFMTLFYPHYWSAGARGQVSGTVSRSKRNGCSGNGEDSGGSLVGLNMVKPYDFCGFFNDLRWQKWGFYLVGGLEHFLCFHILGINGKNSPNWRTHIFQRGRYTTNQWFNE